MKYSLFMGVIGGLVLLSASAGDPAPGNVRQNARHLIEVLELEQLMAESMAMTISQITTMFPEMLDHQDILMDYAEERLPWETIEPIIVEWYSDTFTASELSELAQFHASPLGQKWGRASPVFALRMEQLVRDRLEADLELLELRMKNRELERLMEASVFFDSDGPAPSREE